MMKMEAPECMDLFTGEAISIRHKHSRFCSTTGIVAMTLIGWGIMMSLLAIILEAI